MSERKKFRWMSFPGLLVLLIGCALITGDDDDEQPAAPLYVKSAMLNIRAEPSLRAAVLGQANKGTLIIPLKQAGKWYGIELTDGNMGWVHADYLSPKR